MTIFIQQVINGLMLGSVYALLALGYTMVYGIIKLINFAHGDWCLFRLFFYQSATLKFLHCLDFGDGSQRGDWGFD